MRNFKKLTLASLALVAVGSFAFGVNTLNAYAEGEETTPVAITSQDIVMDGASVRTVSPNGIRFHTYVNESFKENYTFGTLFLPESMLEEGKELTHANYASAVAVNVSNWQETTGTTCEYTCVLAGEQAEGAFGEYPSSEYGTEIVARSYAKAADGTYVYAETSNTRTLVEIASKALADTSEDGKITNETSRKFLAGVVDTYLGETEVSLAQTDVALYNKDAYDVKALVQGANGLEAIWAVEGDCVQLNYDKNGFLTNFNPTKVGTATVTATVGTKTVTLNVTVEEKATEITDLAYDATANKLTWAKDENSTSYNVTVSNWNTGDKTTVTVTENEYALTEELSGSIYDFSVNGVGTFGTKGVAATDEYYDVYVPETFNTASTKITGGYTIFDFDDARTLEMFKEDNYQPWNVSVKDAEWTLSNQVTNTSSVTETTTTNVLKVYQETTDTSGFASFTARLPEAIDFEAFSYEVFRVDGSMYGLRLVGEDGRELKRASAWSSAAGSDCQESYNDWYTIVETKADILAYINEDAIENGTTTLDELLEEYEGFKVKYVTIYTNNVKGAKGWIDNVTFYRDAAYAKESATNFNEEVDLDTTYIADFTVPNYNVYLSNKSSSTKFVNTTEGLKITHNGTWGSHGAIYTLPKPISLVEGTEADDIEVPDLTAVTIKFKTSDMSKAVVAYFNDGTTDYYIQLCNGGNSRWSQYGDWFYATVAMSDFTVDSVKTTLTTGIKSIQISHNTSGVTTTVAWIAYHTASEGNTVVDEATKTYSPVTFNYSQAKNVSGDISLSNVKFAFDNGALVYNPKNSWGNSDLIYTFVEGVALNEVKTIQFETQYTGNYLRFALVNSTGTEIYAHWSQDGSSYTPKAWQTWSAANADGWRTYTIDVAKLLEESAITATDIQWTGFHLTMGNIGLQLGYDQKIRNLTYTLN